MKNRKFSLIGISGIFILSFIVLVLMGYTQTDNPDLVNPQEMIKKAFPNSKITWSKEIQGEMVNFRATSTALAIMIGDGDKRKIKFINFKDTTKWQIECDDNSCRQYKMVGGDEPKLLIRGFKDGMPQTKIIDGTGQGIFDLTLITWLLPSPSGIYYYTTDNRDSYNLLEVYDSEGRFVWKRTEYPGGDWLAQALSDSEMIYEDRTGCYLLDALSGEEIWKISRNQYKDILPGFKLKDAVPASNGKYFVLFHGDGLVSLNAEKGILWLKETPGTVFYVAVSDDGRFVSVYFKERRNAKESKLALMDNLDQGKIIWSSAVKTERYEGTSNIGGLEIVADIVRLIPGIVDYRVQTGITPDMRTLCYQIDGETGKSLREFVLSGVVEIVKIEDKTTRLFLLNTTAQKEISRICEVVIK